MMTSKPAEHRAIFALVLSFVFFGLSFFIGQWSGFFEITSISWLILAGTLIWVVISLQMHQRSLAEQEKLDMSRLADQDTATKIFQTEGEKAEMFATAQRRLEFFEKWFMPIFSVIIAAYEIAMGFYLFGSIPTFETVDAQQPLVCAMVMGAIAFVTFLVSRYCTGMSQQNVWKPLRAGGSLMLAVAILAFSLSIGLALWNFQIFIVNRIIIYITPILMIILGAETSLNVVLDIYRPRMEGIYSRSAFDSRLLGLINEPGGFFHTVAAAIDYQFGFKVSQTWFYKLLEKAIIPLVLFASLVLYLFSCIVVINPDEQAVVERFGNPLTHDGQKRILQPGFNFKWPYPFDRVYIYPTKKVWDLNIGFVPKIDEDTGEEIRSPLLWGKEHYEEEHDVLVASEQSGTADTEGAVPVSLLKANVPVQYRIKDVYSYVYNHRDPDVMLEAICYHELALFAASANVDFESEEGLDTSIVGAGRERAKKVLLQRIQQAADEAGLGIEIVFLGLQGIHPPPDVAPDYQNVVGAVQRKQAQILNADAERNRILTSLVGSVQEADNLYRLAEQYQQAKAANDEKLLTEIAQKIDKAFSDAEGDIFKTLRESQSYAFEKSTLAKASGERFADQIKAYQASKEYYKKNVRLTALEEALKDVRKYVVVADGNDEQVYIVDVQEKLTPSLFEAADVVEENR